MPVMAGTTVPRHDSLQAHFNALTAQLPVPASRALRQVDGMPRKLLASRSYLRAGDGLHYRWSWTEAQIEQRMNSAHHRRLLTETAAVRERFERDNPGYTLYANMRPRSLELQLERWNSNAGVARVAQALHKAALAEVAKPYYRTCKDAQCAQRLGEFLAQWTPPFAAPLAAPGLSSHGQSRAIDFQVMHKGKVVASTVVATARKHWDAPGWTHKLQAAVAGSSFIGPLKAPYEPWHYDYQPRLSAMAAQAVEDEDET